GAHRLQWIVADHRVHQRRVRAAGELAQPPGVDAGPVVVRVADHRRAGGAPDRGLHLHLDGGEAALDDLEQHRVDGHGAPSRATTRLPRRSTVAVKPGCSGTVAPYSSTTAGPTTTVPAGRSGRQYVGVGTNPTAASKHTFRSPAASGRLSSAAGTAGGSGRSIGPTPVTRRF